MLVVNKMDTEGAWDKYKEIEKALHNLKGKSLGYYRHCLEAITKITIFAHRSLVHIFRCSGASTRRNATM